MKNNNVDQLNRFIFENSPVRGLSVCLSDVWQHIMQGKQYPVAIRRALGELTSAAVLLASNLKFDGQLIVQVQGTGVLKMLVAEATSTQTCRATARWDETVAIPDDESLSSLLGSNGMFVVTLQPREGEAWQGIVPLEGESIAQMLMNYMAQSEQLDTLIVLGTSDEKSAGILLQRLPGEEMANDTWEELSILAKTLSDDELLTLPIDQILHRLFHEHEVRLFDAQPVEFSCTCSRGKVSDMLLLLGGEEVGTAVAEQGSIEINCDFCHEYYVFDDEDVNALFGQDVVTPMKLNRAQHKHETLNH